MKKPYQILIGLAVCAAFVVLPAGCEEQNLSNDKKCRIITSENVQLKKQLEQCNKEAEELKKKPFGQLDDDLLYSILQSFGDEKNVLAEENEHLKRRIQQLEGELGNLKKPAEPNTL